MKNIVTCVLVGLLLAAWPLRETSLSAQPAPVEHFLEIKNVPTNRDGGRTTILPQDYQLRLVRVA